MFTFACTYGTAASIRVPMAYFSLLLKRKPPRDMSSHTATFSWPPCRIQAAEFTAVRLSLRLSCARGKADSGPGISRSEILRGSTDTSRVVSFQMVDELVHSQWRVTARLDSRIIISISVRGTDFTTWQRLHSMIVGFLLLGGDKTTPHRSTEGSIRATP